MEVQGRNANVLEKLFTRYSAIRSNPTKDSVGIEHRVPTLMAATSSRRVFIMNTIDMGDDRNLLEVLEHGGLQGVAQSLFSP